TVLETHARNAGAALTSPILDIDRASPTPKGRCIRLWWSGDGPPGRMGASLTLSSEMIGERVSIVAFFPVSSLSEEVTGYNDTEARALRHELRTRISADSTLGGNVTDLAIEGVETGWESLNNTRYRTLDMTIVLDFEEYPISA
ncbi:MAG: hypothetical protein ACRDGB_14535, partial [Candidatus Limnocylindria bacterium]